MADSTNFLATIRAAVAEHAREIDTSLRYVLPGHEVPAGQLPEAVRSAQEFHSGILGHGETGDVLVRRLPPEMGSGFLLVAHHSESRWGLVEVYSPQGELWDAGVYVVRVAAWHDVEVVRQAARDLRAPVQLLPRSTALEWITHGSGEATQFEALGGRFFIVPPNPYGDPKTFVLYDWVTNLQHPCDTADAAKAQALVILSAP